MGGVRTRPHQQHVDADWGKPAPETGPWQPDCRCPARWGPAPKPSVPGTAPHPAPGADRTHGAPPTPAQAQTRHLTCARTPAQRFHSHGTHCPARNPPHATGLAPPPFPAAARSAPSLPGGAGAPGSAAGEGGAPAAGRAHRSSAPPLPRPGGCELTPTSLLPAPPGSVRPRSRPARCQRAGRGVSSAPGTRPQSPGPTSRRHTQ